MQRVLIIGAGIAGQTLACALAMRAIPFDIIEKKADWEILGAGMYVQNNALRRFAEIGVADAIIAAGWKSHTGASIIADADGNELARTVVPPCPGSDFPGYVPISRPVLHSILHDAILRNGINVRMGTTVSAIEQPGEEVAVTFSDGSKGNYSLVVGADGINSATRAELFPGIEPEYSGFSNWRAILPMIKPRDAVTWQMGSERSFGIIPISDDQLYVAGVTKEPGNPWFDHGELLPLMRKRFSDFNGPAHEMLELIGRSDDIVYTPINEVVLPRPWSKGRIVLVGDAAHASTPFWAQGASMAVEDVILLARLLEANDGDPIPAMLRQWEERRYERCVFVQDGSKQTGVRGHAPGREALERAQDHIRNHAQEDVSRRYERLNQPI